MARKARIDQGAGDSPVTHKKRGNGEGSVYQEGARGGTPTGRWVAQVYDRDGKLRRRFAPSQAGAKRSLRELLRDVETQEPIENGNRTVGELLDDWAHKALPNRKLEEQTIAGHRATIKVLKAGLGTKRLRTLTADEIEAALQVRADAGLSKDACTRMRNTLGMALDWAMRRGYIGRNIARVVEIPTDAAPPKPGKSMSAGEAMAFIAAASGTEYGAMWITMVFLGLRPGEAAGLSWQDIDFDNQVVHISAGLQRTEHGGSKIGKLKNAHSARPLTAPLPVLAALRTHRSRQAADQLALGQMWLNSHDLVFTSATGGPSDPSATRRAFIKVVEASGIGGHWTPNQLRHSAFSLMSDAGVPIEVLADQAGHRDTRMQSRHYRHRVKTTVDAGMTMAGVLGSGT